MGSVSRNVMHPIDFTRRALMVSWLVLTVYTLRHVIADTPRDGLSTERIWNVLSNHHAWVVLSCILLAFIIGLKIAKIAMALVMSFVMSIAFMLGSFWIKSQMNPQRALSNAVQSCVPGANKVKVIDHNTNGSPRVATALVNGKTKQYDVRKTSAGNYQLVDRSTKRITNLAGCNK